MAVLPAPSLHTPPDGGPIDASAVAHFIAGLAVVAVLATATVISLSLAAAVVAAASGLYLALLTMMWLAPCI